MCTLHCPLSSCCTMGCIIIWLLIFEWSIDNSLTALAQMSSAPWLILPEHEFSLAMILVRVFFLLYSFWNFQYLQKDRFIYLHGSTVETRGAALIIHNSGNCRTSHSIRLCWIALQCLTTFNHFQWFSTWQSLLLDVEEQKWQHASDMNCMMQFL